MIICTPSSVVARPGRGTEYCRLGSLERTRIQTSAREGVKAFPPVPFNESRARSSVLNTTWGEQKNDSMGETGFYPYEEFKNCNDSSLLLSLSRSAASLCTFSLIRSKRKVSQVKSGTVAIGNVRSDSWRLQQTFFSVRTFLLRFLPCLLLKKIFQSIPVRSTSRLQR